MKKFLSILLAMALLCSITAVPTLADTVPVPALKFTDVLHSDWYYHSIKDATNDLKLFSGVTDDTFVPQGTMTRGMFVTVLGKMAKVDTSKYQTQKFTDVDTSAYYAPYANWAVETGLLSGTDDQMFSPDRAIIREHACTILYRYADKNNLALETFDKTSVSFKDTANLSELSKTAISKLYAATVISGQSYDSFAPGKAITRAEAAALFVTAYYVFNNEEEVLFKEYLSNGAPVKDGFSYTLTIPGYWHGRYMVSGDTLFESKDSDIMSFNKAGFLAQASSGITPGMLTITSVLEGGDYTDKYVDKDGKPRSGYELLNEIEYNDETWFILLEGSDETDDRICKAMSNSVQEIIDSIEYRSGVKIIK